MKNQAKLINFRALTIGVGSILALACGGSDNKDTPANQPTPVLDLPTRDADCAANPYLQDCPQPAAPTTTPGGPSTAPTPPVTQPSQRPADPPGVGDLAKEAALNVLKTNCGQCHGPQGTNQGGMSYIDDIDKLVETGKIKPTDSANSLIVQRMRLGQMPPSPLAKVSDSDIEVVAQYIDNPAFWDAKYNPSAGNCANSGQSFDYDKLYLAVSRDLAEADDDDAINYRYLTLTNRFNAGVCDDTAMDRDRQALNKLVNMLSIDAKLTAPEAIDSDRMVYRIDLRDYQFDRGISVEGQAFNDVWEAVLAFNQFAIEFEGNEADQAKLDSGTTIPVMTADSFLDAASIGNLYYAIVGIDVNQSVDDFIANVLVVDQVQDIEDGDAVRAGTTKSRISRQDRVVERHDLGARGGVLWQSFDFEDDQNESIFQDPFGFNEGGREIIFTQPNGMMAFGIANADGTFVEDSDILLDTQQNNFRAVTSISCSSCHAAGFQPVVDEVKETSLRNAIALQLDRDEIEQLEEVYPAPAAFAEIVAQDSETFYQSALDRLRLPTKGADPVSGIFLQFDRDLTLNDAAGDLGVTPADLRRNLTLLNPAVQVLESGVQDRDDFTLFFEDSLCRLSIRLENQPVVANCQQAALDVAALIQ